MGNFGLKPRQKERKEQQTARFQTHSVLANSSPDSKAQLGERQIRKAYLQHVKQRLFVDWESKTDVLPYFSLGFYKIF